VKSDTFDLVLSLFDPLLIVLNESGVLLDAEFDDLDFKSITGAKTGKPDLNLLFPANANPLLLEAPTFTAFLSCICDCINWAPRDHDDTVGGPPRSSSSYKDIINNLFFT